LFLAANRVGKTDLGSYEMTCHLTGLYPPWWVGKRFDRPVHAWAAGDTSKTVRDILQEKFFGPPGQMGFGMIPKHTIRHVSMKPGTPGCIGVAWVQHVSGGPSILTLKSYEERRKSFQGTGMDVIWLDEEPPEDIYTECLLRTMNTPERPEGGIIYLTFTPLMGVTPLVLSFMQEGHTGPDAMDRCVDSPFIADEGTADELRVVGRPGEDGGACRRD
jgi:phage terminase large subunit-like protein